MNTLFIIPARGGSKGIPRKNIRSLAGKPLLQYSINNALSSKYTTDVYVSSEDSEILNLAFKLNAKTHKRNPSLAKDITTLDEVIYDAYKDICANENKDYDLIVTIQPTSPLLKTSSLDAAIEKIINSKDIDTIISAINDTHLTWSKNEQGYYPNFIERVNRQQLPAVFKETGGFLITRNNIISKEGRIGAAVDLFELSPQEAIDIDTFDDWSLCEYHLSKKRIIFSISGYDKIGLGHVYNSLLLANEILEHEIIFFCDNKSQLAYNKITEHNYHCVIQETSNLENEIISLNPDVIINDHLDTSKSEIKPFIDAGLRVINFEDLGEGARLADLVFNAIYPEEKKLKNHFFGPDYFCARDEFLLTKTKPLNKKVSNILITFGGVDPNNYTLKVLDSIYDFCIHSKIEINVVAGFGYNNYSKLQSFEKAKIHRNIGNISNFMSSSDIAFTSAGRTTYELAILGVPSIVLAQNERELTHFFATDEFGFKNLGLGYTIDSEIILNTFKVICESFSARQTMRDKMHSINLRDGKKKVVQEIKNLLR